MWVSTLLVAASLSVHANINHLQENRYPQRDDQNHSEIEEEIDVVADPLVDGLKGTLRTAVKAFSEGQFDKAEQQFSALARRQLKYALDQHFNRQFAPYHLGLPLQRSAPYTLESLDVEALPPLSAPNASARSHTFKVSGPRLRASASKLFYLRGLAQSRQGKMPEARKSFEKAILLHKNNVDARMDLAILAIKEGDSKTVSRQMTRLDKTFTQHCGEKKCLYGAESHDRYTKLKQIYETNIH